MNISWFESASYVLRLRRTCTLAQFKASFKLPANLVEFLFRKMIAQGFPVRPKHLLWTLYYLKTENIGENNIAVSLGTNRNTLRLYVELTLNRLDDVLPDVWAAP